MAEFELVATVTEIEAGGRKSILVDDTPVLLIRIGDDYYAIEDVCSHDGQPLTDGPLTDHEITCPRHGARFDLATGKPTCMPATEPVATYEIEIRDGEIFARAKD